jgi:hypothetical protein
VLTIVSSRMAFSIRLLTASLRFPRKYGLTIFTANSLSISAGKLWKVNETSRSSSVAVSVCVNSGHDVPYAFFLKKAGAEATLLMRGEVTESEAEDAYFCGAAPSVGGVATAFFL